MKPLLVLAQTALLSTSIIASGMVAAQEYDNTANISAGVTGFFIDSKRNLEDDLGFSLGAEFPVNGRWSVAADYFDVDSEVEAGSNADADLDLFRMGINYHFNQFNGWQPYAGVGLGRMNVDRALVPANNETEAAFDVGLGVKHHINDRWLLRGDYKMVFGDNSNADDNLWSLRLAYSFGQPARTPAARPASAPATAGVTDSDNDGVPDNRDACANTPAGARVDARGCEVDSDRDGVVDSRDSCPDTPTTLAVDDRGCPILETTQRRQELRVNFDFDKSVVKPEYDDDIAEFADFMETYTNTNAVIEGHTDSVGTEEYNQRLSERRANAVRNELVNEHDISGSRISTVGYGESRPVDTNDTAEGRANNRRIEAVISVEVEEQRRR